MNTSACATSRRDFRQRYGDEIAAITDAHLAASAQRPCRSAARDVKKNLQAIVADPHASDVQRVDPLTQALLMDPAWRRFRVQSLPALTAGQLTECAQYALDHFPPFRKPVVERVQVLLTLSLLDAARGWHAARRINVVRAALALVYGADYERATAIIRKAHRELHSRRGVPDAT